MKKTNEQKGYLDHLNDLTKEAMQMEKGKPTIKLTAGDCNAFSVVGKTHEELQHLGKTAQADKFFKKVFTTDCDVLQEALKYVNVEGVELYEPPTGLKRIREEKMKGLKVREMILEVEINNINDYLAVGDDPSEDKYFVKEREIRRESLADVRDSIEKLRKETEVK